MALFFVSQAQSQLKSSLGTYLKVPGILLPDIDEEPEVVRSKC